MLRYKKIAFIMIALISVSLFPWLRDTLTLPAQPADAAVPETISFSLENGFYDHDIEITLSPASLHTRPVEIHYTTDGSTPDASSPLYTEPLSYTAEADVRPVILKAIICNQDQTILGGPYTAT